MTVNDRGRAEDKSAGYPRSDGQTFGKMSDSEFLDRLVPALELLKIHLDKRGHVALAGHIGAAQQAALAELSALQPETADVASSRLKALWEHEGRIRKAG